MTEKAGKNTRDKIVEAAMSLAAERGWAQTRFQDIAERAELDLVTVYDHVEDKTDILVALGRMIDRETLESIAPPGENTSARDRLFDVLMDRFEVLNTRRDGILAVLETFKFDPKQAVISLPHLCRSMTWMLEAAGIDTGGMRGAVRVAGLSSVYLKALKVWMEDESPDLAKTMAALDRDLGRIESWASSLGF